MPRRRTPLARVGTRLGTGGLTAAGRALHVPVRPDGIEGSMVELPGRGSTFVVDTGPRDAPPIVLLHALACTGLLTWYPSVAALRERHRVIVFDQRWHGQGIRSPHFVLDDCADDVVAVADALGIDSLVAVGYSMGSFVAQVARHRHPDRVAGIVLAASTTHLASSSRQKRALSAVTGRLARAATHEQIDAVHARPELLDEPDAQWAWQQFRQTSSREIATVSAVLAGFDSRPFVGQLDVPAAVVVTAHDKLLWPARQRGLARLLGAPTFEVPAGHAACVLEAEKFVPAVVAATASVTDQVAAPRRRARRAGRR